MEDISKRSLSITKIFNASIDLVWKAWTTPEYIKDWWGPDGFTNTIEIMDVRPGGTWKFIMHGPDGTDYKNEYTYSELMPKKKIVLKHLTGPKFTTTVHFFDEENQTRMEWLMVFEKAPDLEKVIKIFRADEGLKQNIIKLTNYLNQLKNEQNDNYKTT